MFKKTLVLLILVVVMTLGLSAVTMAEPTPQKDNGPTMVSLGAVIASALGLDYELKFTDLTFTDGKTASMLSASIVFYEITKRSDDSPLVVAVQFGGQWFSLSQNGDAFATGVWGENNNSLSFSPFVKVKNFIIINEQVSFLTSSRLTAFTLNDEEVMSFSSGFGFELVTPAFRYVSIEANIEVNNSKQMEQVGSSLGITMTF